MDINPRILRYFLTVAEELHFRRAAERLYVTSPALSQQIRHLEQTLGFALFTRTSRSVQLTDKGRELVPLAEAAVAASDAMSAWVSEARGDRRVRVGFMATGAGPLTQQILKAANEDLSYLEVQLVHLDWGEQTRALSNGRVDIAFAREPVDSSGLRCVPVLRERRVVVLPSQHPLARQESVRFHQIADEIFLPSSTGSQKWTDYWLVSPRPDGGNVRLGPSISTVEEMLEQCAAGKGIAITAESVPQFYAHPGVRFVAVEDLPPNHVMMCAREDDDAASVADFEKLVLELTKAT